jgi:hypothetical protein
MPGPCLLYALRVKTRPDSTAIQRPWPLRENKMNPLETIKGTIIAGLLLSVVLAFVIRALAGV